ncbi:lipopolysaccharide biosynthesis protein [Adhaeretor mobilis]|uniref:Lipopolysaccharide biosynthesis protein WzxC n=1 Tax=Adhaeretor mobilis TaxID=1930276 RepID=A0A517MYP3_9BACT|nr:lipopolysaccharide biosynthesis protein [Adhaeretor mobilis]QDS99986.1 Lipopolysaccharide biosynthesis protein WzxC [Adhaeretor mobilis]
MKPKIDYFSSESLRHDLKGKTIRGGLATGIAQALRIVIGLGTIPALARLLQPEDFGLVAMVGFFTNFGAMFVDAGLSKATVQREDITKSQVNTLFWITTSLAISLALGVAAMSPLIGRFYGEPRLVPITLALTISYLLNGLTVQSQALLRRGMQFKSLAFADVFSQLIGQSAGIAWAWRYYQQPNDYWALVLIPLVIGSARLVIIWIACGWLPSKPGYDKTVWPMLWYGLNLSGGNFTNYFARNGDTAIIGWYWGDTPLGFYERAYKLLLYPLNLINGPLTSIAVPALSRLKTNPAGYRRFFRRGVQLSTSIFIPLVIASFVLAEPLVLTLLGSGWEESIPIFLALCPAALATATAPSSTWVYQSWGHTGLFFKFVLVNTFFTLLGFVIAVPFGTFWVAVSYSVVTCVLRVPYVFLCVRPTPLKPSDQFGPMVIPTVASIVAALAVYLAQTWWSDFELSFVQLIAGSSVFGATYMGSFGITPAGREYLREMISTFRPKKRTQA